MSFRTTHWALVALALVSLTCATKPVGSLAGRPVVVILFDALSARHVHHLGYARETTPTLDHLAAEGVSFSQAFAPAPYTLASIPSLMTGALPDRHKVVQVGRALGDQAVTLAERLRASGYQTFGAVANIKGGSLHHVDQGFEVFEELYAVERPDGQVGMRVVEPDEFSSVLRRWTKERDKERPPFFYLHVLQPHLPYAPPSPHRELWLDPTYTGPFRDGLHAPDLIDFIDRGGVLRVLGEQHAGAFGIKRADQDAITALYDANIHYADRALADMLAVLDDAGILDAALVVVTSDHGEAMWEHGRLGHNNDVFDEMLGVPLVLRFPSGTGPTPGVTDALASTLDLAPSILAWLDLPGLGETDGIPLPGLFDPADPERALLLRSFHADPTVGLRTAREKVLRVPARQGAEVQRQAFDVRADPTERHDLRKEDPRAGEALLAELKRRYDYLLTTPDHSIPAGATSAAEAELIRKLGYTE